jgi:Protein of unknown function (DUF998)
MTVAVRLAGVALVGQAVFVATWVVAGALEPGYSHVEQGVSELAMRGAENPWLLGAGLVVLGASFAALAAALRAVLPGGRASTVAVVLFAAAGAAIAAGAFLQLDCPMSQEACRDRWQAGELSAEHDAHLWAGLAFEVLLAATPFALARALWPRPAGIAALAAGLIGLALTGAVWLGYEADADGLVQRLGFGVMHVWLVAVAAGVLHAAGSLARERPSATVPRPAGATSLEWTGEGELVLSPALLWRRFPARFAYRREVTWLTDELWLVEDTASFARGWTVRRRLWCELVAPATLEVTAGDLPDGARAAIEEDGYAVEPCRLALPLGPLQPVATCRERARAIGGGTLRGVMELRWLGVPAARIVARAQPAPPLP